MADLRILAFLASGNDLLISMATVAGIAITALGTFLAVKRAKSGKIETTEAAELWKESTAMRGELRQEVVSLQGEVRVLKDENQELKVENGAWRRRNGALEIAAEDRREVEETLRNRIRELEGKVNG